MNLKPWTPLVLKQHYEEITAQKISFGDDSPGNLRKMGYRSKADFDSQQKQYEEAIYRLATNFDMKKAWQWLIENDSHITAVFHIRIMAKNLLEDWRRTARKNNTERRATYRRIKSLAEKLSKELVEIEFEKDTPLNELNVYLMGHRWFDDQPKTRKNIHSIDCQDSIRMGSLIATAQNLPSLSVLVERIGCSADEAFQEDKKNCRNVPRKMVDDNAFRTYTARYVHKELKERWENIPSYVLLSITQAICDDESLDISHFNKLVKSG